MHDRWAVFFFSFLLKKGRKNYIAAAAADVTVDQNQSPWNYNRNCLFVHTIHQFDNRYQFSHSFLFCAHTIVLHWLLTVLCTGWWRTWVLFFLLLFLVCENRWIVTPLNWSLMQWWFIIKISLSIRIKFLVCQRKLKRIQRRTENMKMNLRGTASWKSPESTDKVQKKKVNMKKNFRRFLRTFKCRILQIVPTKCAAPKEKIAI